MLMIQKRYLGAGLMALTGCAAVNTTTVQGQAIPAPGARPTVTEERVERDPFLNASLVGSVVNVTAEVVTECRTVRTQAMVTPTVEETSLTDSGTRTQWWLGGSAGVLLAGGLAGVLSKCPQVSGTATDGTQYNGQCLSKDDDQQLRYNAGGYAALGGAAILTTLFLANVFRTGDETTTLPAAPQLRPGPWEECAASPASGLRVSAMIGDREIARTTTDREGEAQLDLTGIDFKPFARTIVEDGSMTVCTADTCFVSGESVELPAGMIAEARSEVERLNQLERQKRAEAERRRAEEEREEERKRALAAQKLAEATKRMVAEAEARLRRHQAVARDLMNRVRVSQDLSDVHEVCTNRVGTEVGCGSAAAFSKESVGGNHLKVRNSTRWLIRCSFSGKEGSFWSVRPRTTTRKMSISAALIIGSAGFDNVICKARVGSDSFVFSSSGSALGDYLDVAAAVMDGAADGATYEYERVWEKLARIEPGTRPIAVVVGTDGSGAVSTCKRKGGSLRCLPGSVK